MAAEGYKAGSPRDANHILSASMRRNAMISVIFAGELDPLAMTRIRTALVMLAVAGAWPGPAAAAPPTVTPSSGYDARLQEQRLARTAHDRNLERRRHARWQHGVR